MICLTSGISMANQQAEEAAVIAAEEWLALVDNKQYTESHEQASAEFKKVVEVDGWVALIESVREPFGPLISRTVLTKQYATDLPNAPEGEYVVIQFVTAFENKESTVETVTPMLDQDGQWRVSGYYIR